MEKIFSNRNFEVGARGRTVKKIVHSLNMQYFYFLSLLTKEANIFNNTKIFLKGSEKLLNLIVFTFFFLPPQKNELKKKIFKSRVAF